MADNNNDDKKPDKIPDDVMISFSPQVQAQMDNNSDLAEAMRDFLANVRQALNDVKTGKYNSFDDAMEAITGERPQLVTVFNLDNDDDEPTIN